MKRFFKEEEASPYPDFVELFQDLERAKEELKEMYYRRVISMIEPEIWTSVFSWLKQSKRVYNPVSPLFRISQVSKVFYAAFYKLQSLRCFIPNQYGNSATEPPTTRVSFTRILPRFSHLKKLFVCTKGEHHTFILTCSLPHLEKLSLNPMPLSIILISEKLPRLTKLSLKNTTGFGSCISIPIEIRSKITSLSMNGVKGYAISFQLFAIFPSLTRFKLDDSTLKLSAGYYSQLDEIHCTTKNFPLFFSGQCHVKKSERSKKDKPEELLFPQFIQKKSFWYARGILHDGRPVFEWKFYGPYYKFEFSHTFT